MGDEHLNPYKDFSILLCENHYIPNLQPFQTIPSHTAQASSSLFVSQLGSDLLSVECEAMLASPITVVFRAKQGDLVIAPASNHGPFVKYTLTLCKNVL